MSSFLDHDSRSYPYLALARHYGVDYGLVLDYADYIGDHARWDAWVEKAMNELPHAVKKHIADLFVEIKLDQTKPPRLGASLRSPIGK